MSDIDTKHLRAWLTSEYLARLELRIGQDFDNEATLTADELRSMLTELRERRATDLSDEEREALQWVRDWPQWSMQMFTERHPTAKRALATLDRLLGSKP